jgi:hypothetical protein
VAHVDHVLATSVVTAGGLSLIPCRRWQLNSSFGAGVGVQLLGGVTYGSFVDIQLTI